MTILVLGGAGYIGSHAVDQFITAGFDVAVVDNLLTGHRKAVHPAARFYEGDIRNKAFMQSVFKKESIEGVIHFAASSLVGESMERPLLYFDNNVYGTLVTLEVMHEYGVKRIVFSSTAATYGEPNETPITENMPASPKNPYGESKRMMENMMRWCDEAYGIRYVALRYFNVAGAKLDHSIGEDHTPETHLVPLLLQTALGQRESFTIFGEDYPTKDGTCVRDYVHVVDLIQAHLKAYDYLVNDGKSDAFNLGSNEGFSVKEMLTAARQITGKEIPVKVGPRRAGDPAVLVASPQKAKTILGWAPEYTTIETIFSSAWSWHQTHPHGYAKEE
ncbi:UDP-glucose 4-epimerase GalE [uncultured Enterococcus sp.]|uniref:UDP-glucose 4-epimerase GalE n=1 Tax=uncultured Enterococcus sp. TaxID=167972 RepID=UPI000EBCF1BD|nr:UDP-glucose 4-epimerase GalE [uncultured Enterococcus sp.]HCS30742.1 UDP-glucose 4-epimerase GalE [Enterococcus sp.]